MPRFGRKKSKKSRSAPTEPQWNVNPLVQQQDEQQGIGRVNPLYDPDKAREAQEERNPVLEAFAHQANVKQRTTGKGKGKSVMKDRHVGQRGGGRVNESANDVGSITYKRNIGESDTNVGYFKADGANKVSQEATGAGIATGNDPHLGARAVASSRLDKALGIGVLSHDHFAKHGDKKGIVSAQVQGDALMENHYKAMGDDRAAGYLDMLNSGDMTDQEVENFGNKVVRDEQGTATGLKEFDRAEFNDDVDLTDHNTLKGLADLELMDYLTGQVDRHSGNIHVDTDTGKVTGIDNDLAFGANNDGLELSQNFMGLPKFVDRMTANSFLAMAEKDFLNTIGGKKGDYGKLSSDEKDAALERYRTLRAHVQELAEVDEDSGKDKLVDIWDKDVFDEATAHLREDDGSLKDLRGFDRKNATDSYIARAALDLGR